MSPREQSGSTKVALVLQLHQGVPLRLLTTETMMCFQGRQITSMKLPWEILTQVACRRSLCHHGPVTKAIENLPGSRPARGNHHGQVKVMFQRGTRTCRKELRCRCRRLKNLNPTSFIRSQLMVNNVSSVYEFCLSCLPVDYDQVAFVLGSFFFLSKWWMDNPSGSFAYHLHNHWRTGFSVCVNGKTPQWENEQREIKACFYRALKAHQKFFLFESVCLCSQLVNVSWSEFALFQQVISIVFAL